MQTRDVWAVVPIICLPDVGRKLHPFGQCRIEVDQQVAEFDMQREQFTANVYSHTLHKLSFRRFTYGNLVTTSPSSK